MLPNFQKRTLSCRLNTYFQTLIIPHKSNLVCYYFRKYQISLTSSTKLCDGEQLKVIRISSKLVSKIWPIFYIFIRLSYSGIHPSPSITPSIHPSIHLSIAPFIHHYITRFLILISLYCVHHMERNIVRVNLLLSHMNLHLLDTCN